MNEELTELSFTVSGRVARPLAEVYEDVADPAQLSRSVTTGGARGRLEPEADVTTTLEFEPVDDGARALVTITESSWRATPPGAKSAFGDCEGWTGMRAARKAWVEHGVNLRDGFYA